MNGQINEKPITDLRKLLPSGAIHFTFIHPKRKTSGGVTLRGDGQNAAAVAKEIADKNAAGFNCYFTSAMLRREPEKGKPKKTDLGAARVLHADFDPPPGIRPDDYAEWRKAALDKIGSLEDSNAATMVLNSGNGIQVFLRLSEPFVIPESGRDREEAIQRLEDANRGYGLLVGEAIGASFDDGTQNFDRVMRVPGTFNWPNAEKEKGGRKKTKSAVMVVHAARTVDFAETRYLEHEGSIHRNRRRAQKARGTGQAISLANIDKPAVIASLEQIGLKETILRAKTIPAGEPDPDGVVEDADREVTVEEPNPLAAAIIGCWPMTPDRDEMWKGTDEHGQRIPDRSRVVFAVTHALARRGLTGAEIAGVLLNDEWAISDIAQEQKAKGRDPVRYALSEALQALADVIEEEAGIGRLPEIPLHDNQAALIWMRINHPIIQARPGNSTVQAITYLPERVGGAERLKMSFSSLGNLEQMYENLRVRVGTNKDGSPNFKPPGTFYRYHPRRTQFLSTCFEPDKGAVIPGPGGNRLNLFRGWAVEPKAGETPLLDAHILNILAGGNADHAEYIWRWTAWAVQNPAQQQQVALVLRGPKRGGKGTYARLVLSLVGQHGFHATHKKHVLGNFNSHLRDTLFLFMDELFFDGKKEEEGVFRTLISEPTLAFEGKGKDVDDGPNYLKVIIASNEQWVVPNTEDEQRFAIFEVAPVTDDREAYFKALHSEIENGGREAFLNKLLHYPLPDGWVPWGSVPMTEGRAKQISETMDPYWKYIRDILETREIPLARHEAWEPYCRPKGKGPWGDGLWQDAREVYQELKREPHNYYAFCRALNKVFAEARGSGRGCQLAGTFFGPDPRAARARFLKVFPSHRFESTGPWRADEGEAPLYRHEDDSAGADEPAQRSLTTGDEDAGAAVNPPRESDLPRGHPEGGDDVPF